MTRSEFAHFEKLPDGSGYRVFVSRGFTPDGSRNRASRTVRGSRNKAGLVARELYESLAAPEDKPKTTTLRQFVEDVWLPYERKNPDVGDEALRGYESKIRTHVLPVLGDRLIASITTKDIDDLIVSLHSKKVRGGKTLSPATVRHVYRNLSLVMKYAKRWKYVASNPFDDLDPPKVDDDTYPESLSADEAKRYFDAFRGHLIEPIVLLSLGAGMRPSESMGMRWDDISDGVYRVSRGIHQRGKRVWDEPPKTKASRRPTPLTPWVSERLEELRGEGPMCPDGDEPMTPVHVVAAYGRVVKTFKLRRVTMKNLRHSFANVLKAQGVSPYVIAALMRHSTVKTTEDYYFDADMAPMRVGTDALDALLRPK